MKRRDAILVPLALGATGAQLQVFAQAPTANSARKIGTLELGADEATPGPQRSLSVALRKLGWIEGENLTIERRYAEFKHERLAGLAEDLVRRRVDLILSGGPVATIAAARATRTIPIVFAGAVSPVESGLIDSFARPGRNLTGYVFSSGIEVSIKRLQFLREIAPEARRLSWIVADSTETVAGGRFDETPFMESAAKSLNFETRFYITRRVEDIDTALGEITRWGAQAVSAGGQYVYPARQRIAEFALRHRLPSTFPFRPNVEAGGLLSYGPLEAEVMRMNFRYTEYIDRILRGASPADLPVEQPNKYELLINLKTAKALGITIPPSLLARADAVIQ